MKLLHISDLHIGKRVKGFSLIEDQKHILNQVIATAKNNKVAGVIVAGDIYDVSIPTIEAVNLFDNFVSEIHTAGMSCYAVSGNHDSIYRVTFGAGVMAKENIYFAKKYSGTIEPIDAGENVKIWLIPFIRPIDVREYHSDFEIGNYEQMMKAVIGNLDIDKSQTNILVAHQFVTSNGQTPERSESENVSLGTLDNIDYTVFDDFDYVALGHIHKPQSMGRKQVRYSGSILKYSFSEKNDEKSMVLLDISDKKIDMEFIPFKPLRDMREFVGNYQDLMIGEQCDDYVKLILKDEDYISDIKKKMECRFSNIMEISYDNIYTAENREMGLAEDLETKSPLELFEEFYCRQNNKEMSEEQLEIVKKTFKSLECGEGV